MKALLFIPIIHLTGHGPCNSPSPFFRSSGACITDTQSSRLFRVPPDPSGLEVFMTDPLIRSQNGITISPDNSLLYVESHDNGILVLDLQQHTVEPIRNPMSLDTGGSDGPPRRTVPEH